MKFEFHVYLHADRQIEATLVELTQRLRRIEANMATKNDFLDLINRMNVMTNEIGDRIRRLEERITDAGLSAEDEAAVKAELEVLANRLTSLGQDPDAPIPTEPLPPSEVPPAPPTDDTGTADLPPSEGQPQ